MDNISVGFIGVGNMGGAIINGILSQTLLPSHLIHLYDSNSEISKNPNFNGCQWFSNEDELYLNSDIVFLCIKPQGFKELLDKLKKHCSDQKLIVTIAAGISSGFIQSQLGEETKVIRVMPNAPLMISKGASAISIGKGIDQTLCDFVVDVFSKLGVVRIIEESQMNEIVCVNGSSPAYVYYFIDAMLKSATNQGIDKDVAFDLITQVFIGSVDMMKTSDKTPQQLIQMVCSPGGTTKESIDCFNSHQLYDIIDKAMRACTKRSYELGQ